MKLNSIEIPANRPELAARDRSRFKGVPPHRVASSAGNRLDIIAATRRATRPVDESVWESKTTYQKDALALAVLIFTVVALFAIGYAVWG